jgi:hypothetical protein
MQNIICLIALIAIAALLTWWGFRGWRVRNSFLKWGRLGLAAVFAVTVSSECFLSRVQFRLNRCRYHLSCKPEECSDRLIWLLVDNQTSA